MTPKQQRTPDVGDRVLVTPGTRSGTHATVTEVLLRESGPNAGEPTSYRLEFADGDWGFYQPTEFLLAEAIKDA